MQNVSIWRRGEGQGFGHFFPFAALRVNSIFLSHSVHLTKICHTFGPNVNGSVRVFCEDVMVNWNDTDESGEYAKWANWNMKPKRSSDFMVKHVSAVVFLWTAGINVSGLVA